MRFFKKTVAWVIILMVLAGLSYFFEEKVEEIETAEAEKRRLFKIEPSEIEWIEIVKADFLISVKKSKDGWFIEKPYIASADQKAIYGMLEHTLNANIDGILFEEAPEGKLEELGLEPPYLTASLKTSLGATISFSLGDRGPTQNISFLKFAGEERILRVHADVRSELDKDVYDLRDKTVVAIDPQKLKKVEIIWGKGGKITAHNPQGKAWDTEGLPVGKTDLTKLLAALYGIKEAEASAFIDENPTDLKPYGLERPRLTLKFVDDKNLQQVLLVGGKDKKRRGFYAKRQGDPNVFLLEEDFLDNIPDETEDLRAASK